MPRRRIDRTGTKQCAYCRKWLDLSCFYVKPKNKSGYSTECKDCYKQGKKDKNVVAGIKETVGYTKEDRIKAVMSLDKLNKDVVEAETNGLSYGQYMALRKLKKA